MGVSGLASSIRSATESATFDLAGHDASTIRTNIKDAFSQPLALSDMIRITFVVGGGKLSRSKYDDKAMHAVTGTLKQLDYEEDRGASCVLECAGCYKTQHDTGKNLFTVVVFPEVADPAVGDGGGDQTDRGEDYEPLIPENSPGYKMAVCSLHPTFPNLLSTYCPTYFEKKECMRCLESLLLVEQAIENKMMNGDPLDGGEKAFYDDSSEMKEKYALVQKEASKHVEDGKLTSDEKAALVEMNEKKIETLMNEKSSASTAEKLKKALARKQQLKSLTDDVLNMHPSYPPQLRYENQITALRKKLLPLKNLEDSSRGRLLTLAETRSLTDKEDMDAEVERLEYASCGWFEDEDVFQDRLQKSRAKFKAKYAKSKRGGGKISAGSSGGKGGGGGKNAVNKWILPGEKPKNAWGGSSKKGKMKIKGGAVFSAMMMDSSSEEESESESESEEEELEVTVVKQSAARKKQPRHPAASNVLLSEKAAALVKQNSNPPPKGDSAGKSTTSDQSSDAGPAKKKNKKKKKGKGGKKNKGGGGNNKPQEEEEEVEERTESTEAISTVNDAPSTVSDSLLEFWRSFLWPIIMALLSLIVSLVMSMFSGGKSKKGGKKKRG